MENLSEPGSTILLVESHAALALREKSDLEAAGHKVLLATTGEEALALIQAGSQDSDPDLVLVDVELPKGMDGVETARAILTLRDLPVVFLSPYSEREHVERAQGVATYGYVLRDSGPFILKYVIKTALELHRFHREELRKEAELSAIRERLEAVVAGSGAGTWDWRMDSGELVINERYAEMLGYTKAELEPITGATFVGLTHPEDLPRSDLITERYVAGEIQTHEILIRLRHKDGHWVWVLDRGKVTERDASGKPLRMSGMHFDVSAIKKVEAELEESRRQLSLAIEGSGIGLWDRNFETGRSTYNENWARIVGYSLEELKELPGDPWFLLAHPEDLKRAEAIHEDHLAGRVDVYSSEVRMRHKDGHWVWVLTKGKVMERRQDGSPLRMVGTHLDITERKRTEEAQAALVTQKETLMKELQHRVKNSLALVSSLLGLEMAKIPKEGPREAFAEAIGRIRSISLVYERLYLSSDLASVDLALYVAEVARSTLSTYSRGQANLSLELRLDPVSTDSRRAVPLGLVLSELLVNALKYAYPGGRGGRLAVELRGEGEEILLAVEDEGVGLPPGFDPEGSGSLGVTLVTMLSRQVGGEARFCQAGGKGLRVEIVIPKEDPGP